MPLDASIYNQVGQGAVKPLNQLDAMTNAYALQNAQLSGQAKQQEFTDDQAMRSAYKESGGDSNKLLQLFYGAGLGKQAAALQKSQLDADKIRGNIAKDSASTSKTQQEVKFAAATQHAQNLQLVKDPQDVLSYIDDGIKNGIFPSEKRAVMLQKANGYPSVQAWVQDQVQAAIPQLDRYKEDANNSRSAATNLTSTNNNILTNKTSAANNAATNARIAAEGSMNRSKPFEVTGPDGTAILVQQDKSGSITPVKGFGPKSAVQKPLPPGALKMQQEALGAIGVASSINADLGAVEQQIAKGKLSFGPVSNLLNKGMNASGMSSEESRNFGSFNSTLERLRNDSLRLNAGVQTDGDAQRAWNELFQNINDTGLVKQRLAEIKNINKRGSELQQLKVDGVRANYGLSPMDTSGQRNVPAALGSGSSKAVNFGDLK